MSHGLFVFADLSTYDVDTSISFYQKVFDWRFTKGSEPYYLAKKYNRDICGVYETPDKYKEMRMPSFWMSYISVDDLNLTIKQAEELGGKVELVDDKLSIGKVALIRDPLGAGFTVYEGDQLNSKMTDTDGAMIWNELFVSDIEQVRSFYTELFNWTLVHDSDERFIINAANQKSIGAVQVATSAQKGDKEYWSVYFGVADIARSKILVESNGGRVLYDSYLYTVCEDPKGAFFHISQINTNDVSLSSYARDNWKAIFGIMLIGISIVTNWMGIWAIFFTAWIYMDLRSGITHMFQSIERSKSPALYWIVLSVWTFIGIYSIIYTIHL